MIHIIDNIYEISIRNFTSAAFREQRQETRNIIIA